jgi:hypothetical protein
VPAPQTPSHTTHWSLPRDGAPGPGLTYHESDTVCFVILCWMRWICIACSFMSSRCFCLISS